MNSKRAKIAVTLAIVAASAFVAGFALQTEAAPFNCKIVSCPCPACLDSEHLETPPGQCCPVCVPN
jgi:hypothetical protein